MLPKDGQIKQWDRIEPGNRPPLILSKASKQSNGTRKLFSISGAETG